MTEWDFLSGQAFAFLAVVARIGTIIMLMPGIGEINVPARIRLMLALATSAILLPIVGPLYPPPPEQLLPFAGIILGEIAIGLAIGMLLRFFLMALQTAGHVIATQGGLAFAQSFDPALGIQGAIIGSFLSILALTLIFQADLHHLMFLGLKSSYGLLPPGGALPVEDLAARAVRVFSDVFTLGVRLSAPVLVFSLVFYVAAGVISKLLPQIQIFFLAMPVNIFAAFALVMLGLSTMMLIFLEAFGQFLAAPLG